MELKLKNFKPRSITSMKLDTASSVKFIASFKSLKDDNNHPAKNPGVQKPAHDVTGGDVSADHVTQDCYVGHQLVNFFQLKEPNNIYRVRHITESRVDYLYHKWMANGADTLDSDLCVLVADGQEFDIDNIRDMDFIIVDGNHRFRAMKRVKEKRPFAFTSVNCHIYQNLEPMQAIGLGYNKNRQAHDVHKMTDFDKVRIIRMMLLEDPDLEFKTQLDKIYQYLNLISVSKVQLM